MNHFVYKGERKSKRFVNEEIICSANVGLA